MPKPIPSIFGANPSVSKPNQMPTLIIQVFVSNRYMFSEFLVNDLKLTEISEFPSIVCKKRTNSSCHCLLLDNVSNCDFNVKV